MARYLDRQRRPRVPRPDMLRTGRRRAAYCLGLLTDATGHPTVSQVLSPEHLPLLRSSIRSAALGVTVFGLWRDALQRLAVFVTPPMSLVVAIVASWLTLLVWSPRPGWALIIVAAGFGFIVSVTTLLILVVVNRGTTHVIIASVLAACGAALIILVPGPSMLIRVLTAAFLVPAAMYVGATPLMVIAYVVARRLGRFVDPRARVILGLLDCTCDVAAGRLERRGMAARVEIAAKLERTARALEQDLPRVIRRRAQDADTRRWLRDEASRIAARIRSGKRLLALPSHDDDALLRDLATMLLSACRDEWGWFSDGMTAKPTSSLWKRIARHVGAAAVLITAGIALPELLGTAVTGTTADALRAFLVISGALALFPLPKDGLNRVTDTFGHVAGA